MASALEPLGVDGKSSASNAVMAGLLGPTNLGAVGELIVFSNTKHSPNSTERSALIFSVGVDGSRFACTKLAALCAAFTARCVLALVSLLSAIRVGVVAR